MLPRFCLESYLVNPAELWDAFPQKQKDKIDGGLATLQQALTADLTKWLRHAALWHAVKPAWKHLRQLGFPDDVLDVNSAPDDEALRVYFLRWHKALNADILLSQFHNLEAELINKSFSEFSSRWLYAKDFYPQVVHQKLNFLLGQKSAAERRLAIFKTRSIPEDLNFVWQAMAL